MVAEKFQFYGVKINAKYICESVQLHQLIFTHATKQHSHPGVYHDLQTE